VLHQAKKLAVVSADYAINSNLASLFKRRWSDVVEIPNGVDISHFHPNANPLAIKQKYNLGSQTKVILLVAVLDEAHYFKGTTYLLKAMAKIANPDARLIIVGDGDLKPQFLQLATQLNISERVIFAGKIANQLLPEYYAAADMVVLPSTAVESFGMVLLEGMACGKVVIASNIPGVRSVVTDGHDGLLVKPADATDLADKLQLLLNDAGKRAEMGRHGRAKVEAKYAWSAIIPRLETLYQTVLAGK
jgi:glycosyltransferase involved in cell wall biosynthesis